MNKIYIIIITIRKIFLKLVSKIYHNMNSQKEGKTTLYDIAKEAEVSVATVSRAINRREQVKNDKVIHILNVMNKLGFKPNLHTHIPLKSSIKRSFQ